MKDKQARYRITKIRAEIASLASHFLTSRADIRDLERRITSMENSPPIAPNASAANTNALGQLRRSSDEEATSPPSLDAIEQGLLSEVEASLQWGVVADGDANYSVQAKDTRLVEAHKLVKAVQEYSAKWHSSGGEGADESKAQGE